MLVGCLPHKIAATVSVATNWLNLQPTNKASRSLSDFYGPLNFRMDCQAGLLQGSPLSALIADATMAYILSKLPKNSEVKLVVIGDNMFLLARKRSELEETRLTLTSAWQRCLFGYFRITIKGKGVTRVDRGFDYLGYRLRLVDGRLTVRPSDRNMKKLWVKSRAFMRGIQRGRRAAAASWETYQRSWVAAFSHWLDAESYVRLVSSMVASPPLERQRLSRKRLRDDPVVQAAIRETVATAISKHVRREAA